MKWMRGVEVKERESEARREEYMTLTCEILPFAFCFPPSRGDTLAYSPL